MRPKIRSGKRPGTRPLEDRLFRFGAALTGATLMASATLSADLAGTHMSLIDTVCGAGPHPHCGWCLGAASLAIAGLAAFYLAIAPASDRGSGDREARVLAIRAGSRRRP